MKKHKNKIWQKKLQVSLEFEKFFSQRHLLISEEVAESLRSEESCQ